MWITLILHQFFGEDELDGLVAKTTCSERVGGFHPFETHKGWGENKKSLKSPPREVHSAVDVRNPAPKEGSKVIESPGESGLLNSQRNPRFFTTNLL